MASQRYLIFIVIALAFPSTFSTNASVETSTSGRKTTAASSPDINWPLIVEFSLILLAGVALICCDGLLAATILVHRKLRQRTEQLVVCSMALANVLYGVGFLSSAITRLSLILGGDNNPLLVTRWSCMCQFFMSVTIVGQIAMSMAMTSLSIDRLIAVSNVGRYLSLGRVYLLLNVGTPFATALSFLAVAWLLAYFDTETSVAQFSSLCFLFAATPLWFSILVQMVQATFATLSIVIYVVVVIVMISNKSGLQGVAVQQAKRQLRVTKSVGVVATCTMILFVVPDLLVTSMEFQKSPIFALVAPFLGVVMGFSEVVGFAIYVAKQKEVRAHMLQMMRVKSVPKLTFVLPVGRNRVGP